MAPLSPAELLASALAQHQAQNFVQAKDLYHQVLAADPGSADARHLLGLIARAEGDLVRAVELIRDAIRHNPLLFPAYYNLGNILRAKGDLDGAIALYRATIIVHPGFAEAYCSLGGTLYRRDRLQALDVAIDALRRGLALNPAQPVHLTDLGVLLQNRSELEEAAALHRKALAYAPDLAGAHANLGTAILNLGDPETAIGHYQRAVELEPRSGATQYNLANAFLAANRLEEAEAAYARAVELGVLAGQVQRASILRDLGRGGEAEALLRQLIGGSSEHAGTAVELLGSQLIEAGRTEEARQYFSRLPSEGPPAVQRLKAECLTIVADTYLKDGRPREAFATVARVDSAASRLFAVKSVAALQVCLQERGVTIVRRPADPSRRRVATSTLRSHGRFAHNVFEYILVRLYAERFGMDIETPEWVGGYFFELDDPLHTESFRPFHFARYPINQAILHGGTPPAVDQDVLSPLGLYSYDIRFRERIQSWLRPRQVWMPYLAPALDALRSRGKTVVALHLRRGDFVWCNYPITQTEWHRDWLHRIWPTLDNPVLYLASDDLENVRKDFAEFAPVSLPELAPAWPGLEFLQDFFVLMNADVLGVSGRSWFSQLSALLNSRASLFGEPDFAAGRIVPFSPWKTGELQ